MVTMRVSGTVMDIFNLEDIGLTTLTVWGHVTSSVREKLQLIMPFSACKCSEIAPISAPKKIKGAIITLLKGVPKFDATIQKIP